VVADEAHGDALHAAGAGGLHAGHGILEDDASCGRDAQPLGRHQEYLRVRLAALRILRADHRVEEAGDAGQPQNQLKVGVRGAGADGLGETRRVQLLHQLPHARQQFHPRAGRFSVEHFLAIAQRCDFRVIEAVAEQLANDLRIALAEGGREVGPREVSTVLAAYLLPGLEVQFRRINQRPIHVPNGCFLLGARHHPSSSEVSSPSQLRLGV
jgi:hypothetical protein